MANKLTDDQLKALAQSELRRAVGLYGGKLAEQRRKAEVYYYAEAKDDLAPPDIEGRSRVVVPRVRNTILSMLPPLMVKFCGGDTVVEFEPTKPGDEQAAQQATDYCNYIFFRQNNGHAIVRAWFMDALKYKNGIIKVWWDDKALEEREEYRGLTPVELAQIADDPEVEITAQKSYQDEEDAQQRQKALEQLTQQLQQAQQAAGQPQPPQQPGQPPQAGQAAQAVAQLQAQIAHIQSQPQALLFDIECKRTKDGGRICVENVPPEEFGINRDARTIEDARFIRHSVLRTLSDLRAQGYSKAQVDAIGSDEESMSFNMERIERLQFDDEMAAAGNEGAENADPSQRRVWVHECYLRVDADGDGIAELRKVTLAGNEILDNEIVDAAPFVSICPVPEPHKFYGLSIADLAMVGEKIETELLRGVIDNNRIQLNGRFFAVEGEVNLDDLLMSRPGGVVRVKNPQAVGKLEQGMGDMASAMNLLGYMESFNADATGYSNQSQSFDTDALDGSETATKTRIVSNKASMRTDDVARNFAEGFVALFRMMLKLLCQRQNKAQAVRLTGQWVNMDPREWRNQFDVSINVGLGVGDKDQQVSHLNLIMQVQQHAMGLGVANPTNVYNAAVDLEKAIGYKGGRYFTQPNPNAPPPNPAMQEMQAKLAGQMQIEQAKMQGRMQSEQGAAQIRAQADQQKLAADMQMREREAVIEAQLQMHAQQVQAQQNALQNHLEAQRAQMQATMDAQLEAQRQAFEARQAQTEQAMQLLIAHMNNAAKVQVAEVTANTTLQAAQISAANAGTNDTAQ